MITPRPVRAVVFGSVNMDLVARAVRLPRPGETLLGSSLAISPGGKGANQAVACARLGADTSFVGCVGGDLFGRQLVSSLRSSGVKTRGVTIRSGASSGTALIVVGRRAQNQIVYVPGANALCDSARLRAVERLLPAADVLLLQLEIPVGVSMRAARAAKRLGKLVVLNPAPARRLSRGFLRLVDCLTPNETEAAALLSWPSVGLENARMAARALLAAGPKAVVITLGARGAVYASSTEAGHVRALPVKPVDTTGAGDAFTGALAVAMAEGQGLAEAVQWATAAGAVAVTRSGAQQAMPTRADVEAALEDARR